MGEAGAHDPLGSGGGARERARPFKAQDQHAVNPSFMLLSKQSHTDEFSAKELRRHVIRAVEAGLEATM